MTEYTTLALVKTELAIAGSANDARLTALIIEASALINSYCGRSFEQKTSTEKVKGYNNSGFLRLTHTPIISITSIVRDNVTIDANAYELDDAEAGLIAGNWYSTAPSQYAMARQPMAGQSRKLYTVVYVGGYVLSGGSKNLPADIERACIELVRAAWLDTGVDLRVTSEQVDGVGGFTYGGLKTNKIDLVKPLLNKYRNAGAML